MGALRHCEGRLRSGARPPPAALPQGRLLESATHLLWARACGHGAPALSLWLRGAACGGGGGRPSRGGWPCTVVRGVWCWALSLLRPPAPWGRQPGFGDPCFLGAVGVGVGTQHRPHRARSCEPLLRPVGVAGGRPRGGCLAPLRGASVVRRSPSPGCPSSGRAVGVERGGPALFLWLAYPVGGCVPRGCWEAVSGGWPFTVVRGVWCQALPLPRPLVPWGRQPGFCDPCFRSRLVWPLGPSTGPRACALASRRCVLWRWWEGVPRGGCPAPL